MAKDKKKQPDKKAKLAEKKLKQEKKAEKKAKVKAAKLDGSDVEDVDLDNILEQYKKEQEAFLKVTETVIEAPPRSRSAACFLANPANSNELLLFGGEYFNGSIATFFGDLNVYIINRNEWRSVTSPNAPLPRSGHAWCRGGNQSNSVFLFGGEFSSPKQGTFYHYNDFWKLDPASREWSRLEPKGKTPPARSGHRMTYFKQYIILFGGFQDTSNQTKYLSDLWLYDTNNFVWYNPTLPPAQLKPDARSSFTFLPHEQGAVLYGGYSRVKTSVNANKASKGGGNQAMRSVLKPMIHQDCFFLRITPPPAGAPSNTPPVVRWEKRKKPANSPNPTRAGATMAHHKGRGILFGGVHDVEESEEGMDSEFFNQMFAFNIERNRFFPLPLRKPRVQKKRYTGDTRGGGRRHRAAEKEEELLRQLAALDAGKSLEEFDEAKLSGDEESEESEEEKSSHEMPVLMQMPAPRFNTLLAVQGDILWMYGGTFEKDDREITFDDLYAVDLGKMDGCKEVFNRLSDDWVVSYIPKNPATFLKASICRHQANQRTQASDEEEDDEDEDEGEDEDEDGEEEMAEDEDIEMEDTGDKKAKPFTPSKRKTQQDLGESTTTAETASKKTTEGPGQEEEEEEDTSAAAMDDGLPHPRPFESRREFFVRTSNEWQELLLGDLRKKGVAADRMSIKELKAKAFQLSEEQWWGCREEITAMEEEQEAAGISEVVSLAERGGEGGGTGGTGRRR